jgi:hypothetical protein
MYCEMREVRRGTVERIVRYYEESGEQSKEE